MKITKRAAVTKLTVFHASVKKSKQMAIAARNFYSLTYRYRGKISIKTDNVDLISEENSLTFMPRGVDYLTEIIEDMEMAVIHFELDGDVDFRTPAVLHVSDGSVRRLFDSLVRLYRADDELNFVPMSMLYELFARLEELAVFDSFEKIPKKISLAKRYIDEECCDYAFSVSALADRLGISTAYLRREFAAVYGKNPISYLKSARISRAKNMLEAEYPTVAEIAEQCGFGCSSYFIQAFRREVGMTPNAYRLRSVLR